MRRTHDGRFAWHPRRGISGLTGADRRAQFAQTAFPPRADVLGCENFVRCGAVVLALVPAAAGAGDVHAVATDVHASAQSAYFKYFCSTLAWLLLQAACVRGASAVVERGAWRAGTTMDGADVKIFAGVVDSKKTVIRFRLSRPCLPNRVRRINRPMRSSPSRPPRP